jgi:hypothetical protein
MLDLERASVLMTWKKALLRELLSLLRALNRRNAGDPKRILLFLTTLRPLMTSMSRMTAQKMIQSSQWQ